MRRTFLRVLIGLFLCCNLGFASTEPNDEVKAGQQFASFDQCQLTSGKVISPCRIGYRTHGKLNADRSNAILVPTWFGASSADHAYLASPELLDPDKYFIVIVDALGNGVSTSPSNSETQPNEQFPQITITDMVRSQHRLLTEVLGITSLHAVVGLSMGGKQAFEWAVRYRGFAAKTVAAIASPRLPSYDIVLWTTRNRLLARYRECRCSEILEVMAGVGMLGAVPTKLSEEVARTDVLSALDARSKRYAVSVGESWDEQRQAEAMIGHNIASEFNDDMQLAAAHIDTDFLIVVGQDDRTVTPQPARDFAAQIGVAVLELDKDCGHADLWCAADEFAAAVSHFIDKK